MPKYKVRYTFDVIVDAPSESIAWLEADLEINPDCASYLWKDLIDKKIINIEIPEELKDDIKNGTQTALTFKFDDEHSYAVEVEDIEQLKPSELYEKRMLDCLVNYKNCFNNIENEGEKINNEKQN